MLNALADRIFEDGKAKGWHTGEDESERTRERVATFLVNLNGEVGELWEAFREGNLDKPCDKADKMREARIPVLTCLEEELADIVIRALDTAHTFGVDIDWAVDCKMAFNKTRPHRHGGKRA